MDSGECCWAERWRAKRELFGSKYASSYPGGLALTLPEEIRAGPSRNCRQFGCAMGVQVLGERDRILRKNRVEEGMGRRECKISLRERWL